ncbi:MAG: exodeoxyribonuclease VII large subunit, partial [Pseudomonadota bacterium]|nr:exodeoxyribonuclease VII large subunit [Pseudomonadota bacterium]
TLYPTAVQGQPATADIVQAIDRAQQHGLADVLIIGRGGGSLEDLWCFNEEAVARAIAACPIPTVSAVGHEVDVTIADFVADLRAPTPSAAAEKISPDQQDWLRRLTEQQGRLGQSARRLLQRLDNQLGHLSARLRDPRRELLEKAQRMDELELRLNKAIRDRLDQQKQKTDYLLQRMSAQSPRRTLKTVREQTQQLEERLTLAARHLLRQKDERLQHIAQTLHVVSPLATLGRGYAIVRDDQGRIVRKAGDLETGDQITARLGRGSVSAQVTEINSSSE